MNRLEEIFEKYSVEIDGKKVLANKAMAYLYDQAEAANKWSKQLAELNHFLEGRADDINAGHQLIYVSMELIKRLENRVEELEEAGRFFEDGYKQFEIENEHYKQALEEILNKASRYMGNSAANRLYEIAHKALEESE